MGAQPSKLQRKATKGVKMCISSSGSESNDDGTAYQLQHYPCSPSEVRRNRLPTSTSPAATSAASSRTSEDLISTFSSSPSSAQHRMLSSTKSSLSSSWLEDNCSSSLDTRSELSRGSCVSPPSRREQILPAVDVTHFRHIHQHQGRLAAASRSASTGSVTSMSAQGPLKASWSRLETDLEYYGMILLDKIIEQEPQACYLMTFTRHTDMLQLLSSLTLQRQLAVRIMETVGLMVEAAEDWRMVAPVLNSLERRHNVGARELRGHVQVINSSLFATLHVALGADWSAEMAVAWKALLAQACSTLFSQSDTRCGSPSHAGHTSSSSSNNNLAWTSVKWKPAEAKSSSPLPFKSLDDLTRAWHASARSNRLPSLRLTRTTSASPTKEMRSRKSSSSSTAAAVPAAPSSSAPLPKSPLRRSWSSR